MNLHSFRCWDQKEIYVSHNFKGSWPLSFPRCFYCFQPISKSVFPAVNGFDQKTYTFTSIGGFFHDKCAFMAVLSKSSSTVALQLAHFCKFYNHLTGELFDSAQTQEMPDSSTLFYQTFSQKSRKKRKKNKE